MTVLNKQFILITCCSMKIICIQTQLCLGFNTLMDQIKISCELSHNMQEEGWQYVSVAEYPQAVQDGCVFCAVSINI